MSNVIVIGGGAAGMYCAALAAEYGHRVTLLEQNEKLGKKLFITGKGRCNFTNHCTPEEFRGNVVSNPRFLYSASESLSPEDVMTQFEEWGMKTKTERGRRAFPLSDDSSDVIDALRHAMQRKHVSVRLNTKVTEILTENGTACGVKTAEGILRGDRIVVATGGLSYPSTGSTGDGFHFAEKLNLQVTPLSPSLVPICCGEEYVKELQGLSLRNVSLRIRSGKKTLYDEFGEMMFTHYGITGPLVLSASAKIGPLIGVKPLTTVIDLKPALTVEQLDARLLRLFDENRNKTLKNILHELYPMKMHPVIPELAGISPDRRIHEITREERMSLIRVTKEMPLTLTALRGYPEAVITKGGVSVKEIDPKTMAVKSVPGLYFIGEVLDLDAYTGGYNLQIAWCTAAAAARSF